MLSIRRRQGSIRRIMMRKRARVIRNKVVKARAGLQAESIRVSCNLLRTMILDK